MAGYRRVNYYELCRLCTSSEGAKMHIFREEGRKRQLPTKIQICLPVQVCEDDSLPKIICTQCVEKLENFYDFRESCVNAESMLESYFTSFRYSDDFSREGKVYVKEDNSSKKKPEVEGTDEDNSKELTMDVQDGLSSLVQAAGIQLSSEEEETTIQQYKCAMQMQGGTSGGSVLESTSAASEPQYSYETCGTSNSRLSDASVEGTNAASAETPSAKLEDGSTQCNETDFKNNGMVRNQGLAENSDEGEALDQQQIQSVAFAAAVPGQEVLLQFSFKDQREVEIQSEEQSDLQSSSIDPIGEFLRIKSTSIAENEVESPAIDATTSDHQCTHCGKQFDTLSELNSHQPCSQESPGDTSSDQSSTGNISISCEVCNKPFKRKEHLFQHRKLHTGERPYVCAACGKAFSRKEHLVRHTVSHTGQKVHACEMCGKAFSRKDNLHKHRKTHGIAGQFHCDACGKSFVVKQNYMMHKSSEGCSSDDAGGCLPLPHPNRCDLCNKVFSTKHYLNIHRQKHRSRAAKARARRSDSPPAPADPALSMPNVDSPEAAGAEAEAACESLVAGAAGSDDPATADVSASLGAGASPPPQPPEELQGPEVARQQEGDDPADQAPQTLQLDQLALAGPLAATLAGPLAALPGGPLLAPGLLQHVGGANPTMAIHVSTAPAAYLSTPPNDILETYRRLHST